MAGKILLRGSLTETEQKHSTSTYSSPDIITHDQVSNPTVFFTQNYDSDPNQYVETLNNNYIYARVKNIGDEATEENYVHLFSHVTSLYLNPKNWEKYRISTVGGNRYSTLPPIKKDEIAATSDYFLFNGTKQYGTNCCFACVVCRDKNPDFSYLNSYVEYYDWIHDNLNVAARNMRTTNNYRQRQFEDLYNISNPYSNSAHVIYQITAHGLVSGTTYGLETVTIDGKKTEKKYTDETSTHSIQAIGTLEAGYDDYISIYGILPEGSTAWPDGAYFEITARIAYADSASFLSARPDRLSLERYRLSSFANPAPRALSRSTLNDIIIGIPIGGCTHKFVQNQEAAV